MRTLEEITASISALEERANEATTRLEAKAAEGTASRDDVAEVKAVVDEMQPKLAALNEEYERALDRKSIEDVQSELTTLGAAISELKKPAPNFQLPFEEGSEEGKALDEFYGDGLGTGQFSAFADVKLANKGNQAAIERLTKGLEVPARSGMTMSAEGKALTEGVQAQGGYLVRPVIERQLVEARELDNVLRGLCSKLNISTNAIQLDQLAISTTAGWVAELAQKPEDVAMSLASLTASVFTAAGLVTVSNQLLADSNPQVDTLAMRDLTRRLVALEETAFMAGDGNGKPLGILNTPGIQGIGPDSNSVLDLLLAILQAVSNVQENHGQPNAILMHPRTWTRILMAQFTGDIAPGAFIIGGDSAFNVSQSRTVQQGPSKLLWGVPVVLSNRVPTNLGSGTNESRVIVGDFQEALILDRQGITVDESSHVYFTTNQTVFRAEERVGFTAARNPRAFNIVGGANLANG